MAELLTEVRPLRADLKQNRWTDFNGRLDDLERSLSSGSSR